MGDSQNGGPKPVTMAARRGRARIAHRDPIVHSLENRLCIGAGHASRSMRHQHGNVRIAKDVGGGAAEDEFSKSRVPIAAHHQHVGAKTSGFAQKDGSGLQALA